MLKFNQMNELENLQRRAEREKKEDGFYHQPNRWTMGRFLYTPAEFDIVSILISKIEIGKTDYKIHIHDIEDISQKEWNEDQLFANCISIMSKPFNEKTETGFRIYHIISDIVFNRETRCIDIAVNNKVLDDLFKVKANMTYLELKSVVALNRQHAKRIYGWCSQFKSSGFCKLKFDDAKTMLGLKDAKREKYILFKEFNRSVLKPSVDEINEKTNLNISCEIKFNKDKAPEWLFFYIKEKKNIRDRNMSELSVQGIDATVYQFVTAMLLQFDMNEVIVDKIARISTYNQCRDILDEIEAKKFTNNPVQNPAKYIYNYYSERLGLNLK